MVYNPYMQSRNRAKQYPVFVVALCLLGFLVPEAVFAYEAAPIAYTMSPTFVTEKSIQLNGAVKPNEMADTVQWFEWGIVGRSEVYSTPYGNIHGGNSQVTTRATIVGLAPATQYFFRQVVENGRGKDIGQIGYVTTKPLPTVVPPIAVVVTNDAIFVDETSATLRGYVSPHGNNETQAWFEWGLTTNLENETSHRGFGGNSGPEEVRLSKLTPGTLYYFRAVAENSSGRSYVALKVLLTRGTPPIVEADPVASVGEAPREQYVPAPVRSTDDGVSRQTTASGKTVVQERYTNGLPVVHNARDFFDSIFGRKSGGAPANASDEAENDKEEQVASPAAADTSGDLWGLLAGDKSVEVAVEKIGDEGGAHVPVEYRIAFAYNRDAIATDAKLKIVFPTEVIYIGDNTNNELLVESGAGVVRTYVLPLGRLERGATRSVSILGMVTAGTSGIPDVRVRLEYTDEKGTHVVPAGSGALTQPEEHTAGVGGIAGILLPNSLLGCIIYIISVIAAVFGIRKLKEYYTRKKELLARRDEENEQLRTTGFFGREEEVTPQGA